MSVTTVKVIVVDRLVEMVDHSAPRPAARLWGGGAPQLAPWSRWGKVCLLAHWSPLRAAGGLSRQHSPGFLLFTRGTPPVSIWQWQLPLLQAFCLFSSSHCITAAQSQAYGNFFLHREWGGSYTQVSCGENESVSWPVAAPSLCLILHLHLTWQLFAAGSAGRGTTLWMGRQFHPGTWAEQHWLSQEGDAKGFAVGRALKYLTGHMHPSQPSHLPWVCRYVSQCSEAKSRLDFALVFCLHCWGSNAGSHTW